jgi:hypothetical protein
MTEAEWLACTDPGKMLEFLRGKASDRKLRLFPVACCRLMWSQLPGQRIRRLVEVAERFADGLATAKGLRAARSAAEGVWDEWRTVGTPLEWPFHAYAALVVGEVPIHLHRLCGPGNLTTMSVYRARAARRARQQAMLRDLFGNPFRPATLDPGWLTPDVLTLAQAAYDHRTLPAGTLDPARLALLADALEDAGCDNADLLGHLRGPGPHVRGCWSLDLILGKE